MAIEIGIIKELIGTATAISAEGTQRNLQVGDRIFADDIIATGIAGAVEIEFDDGSVMDLGRSSQALLDNEVFNLETATPSQTDVEDDVAALQQALLDGTDPTQAGEATAAGADVVDGNEGNSSVTVEFEGDSVTPDAGFDTTGVSVEFPELIIEELALVEEGITSEDTTATLVIGDAVTVVEANGNYLEYSVSLSNAVGNDIAVTLNTAGTAATGDTATSGTDYNSALEYHNGTAWVAVTGATILPADGSAVQVRVAVIDDAITENTEAVILGASSTDARLTDSSDTGTGLITDDAGTDNPPVDEDTTATLVIGDAVTVVEANGNYLEYSVSLSNAVGNDIAVTLNTAGTAATGDTATSGADYNSALEYHNGTAWVAVTGATILPADGSAVQVRVAVIDDAITENTEAVILGASSTDARLTDSSDTGTGLITDDAGTDNPPVDEDTTATLVIGDAVTVVEANGNYLEYSVSLSNAVGNDIAVTLNTAGTAATGDTATSGADYNSALEYHNGTAWVAVTGATILPADGSAVQVRVAVIDDAITENTEAVILGASSTDARLTDSSDTGTGLITDDAGTDNPPVDEDTTATLVIGDAVTVVEANGNYLEYSVSLSNAVGNDIAVTLNTAGTAATGDTATSGADYNSALEYHNGTAWVAVTGATILPADGSAVQVRVAVIDDAITENTEAVILGASSTDARLTDSSDTGTGLITDDAGTDNPPVDEDTTATLVIGDAVTVVEANGNYLEYSVSLSNAVGNDIAVTLNTAGTAATGDTATSGADYNSALEYHNGTAWVAVTGATILPADGSAVQVRVAVIDDAITENTEAVILGASSTDARLTDSSDTGTGLITDDDNTVDAVDDGYEVEAQGEFSIASFGAGEQSVPDIASLNDGGYVVAWTEVAGSSYNGVVSNDINNDGDINDSGEAVWDTRVNHDVFLQRYDVNGDEVGAAVRVNTLVIDTSLEGGRSQHDVNVVGLDNGNYLVTWMSDDHYIEQDAYDNGSRYLQAQIYDENGNHICEEFTIARSEYDPIVGLPDGGFIVTWSADARLHNSDGYTADGNYNPTANPIDNPIVSDFSEVNDGDAYDGKGFGIVAQRYDAYGNEVGGRLLVNTNMVDDQIDSDIIMLADGTAIMTWQSANQDSDGFGIYSQKLALTAGGLTKVGSETIINTTTAGDQTDPEVTALSNGGAVITWESEGQLVMQVVNADLTFVGGEITVSATGSNPVITETNGGFVVVWQDAGDIYSQLFDDTGTAINSASVVNIAIADLQSEPAITSLVDGGYVITYESGDGLTGIRFNEDGTPYVQIQNSFTMDEDTSLTINVADLLTNDSDPEGHTFDIISVQSPVNGTVSWISGATTILFTPDADYNGPATFTYTIQDELGAVDTATVHMMVNGVGEPTIFVGATCDADLHGTNVTVNEGEDVVFGVRVGGAQVGDIVTLSLADGSANEGADFNTDLYQYSLDGGSLWVNVPTNGEITLVASAETILVKTNTVRDGIDENSETFNLTATLSSGLTDLANGTGTATILDNEAPTSTNGIDIIIDEDNTYIVTKSDFGTYADAEDDAFDSVQITTLPVNGGLLLNGVIVTTATLISVADIEAGNLIFNPTVNTDNDSSFTFKVSDGDRWSTSDYATVITINAVADAPTLIMSVNNGFTLVQNSVLTPVAVDSTDVYAYADVSGIQQAIIDGTLGINTGANIFDAGTGNGVGVQTGSEGVNDGAKTIEPLEAMVFAMPSGVPAESATILFKHAKDDDIDWAVYDKDGVLVDSGQFPGITDEGDYTETITPSGLFSYMVISGAAGSGTSQQGFNVHSVELTRPPVTTYALTIEAGLVDGDGSESLGVVTIAADSLPDFVSIIGTGVSVNTNGDYEIDTAISSSVSLQSNVGPLSETSINNIMGSITSTEVNDGTSATTDSNVKVEFTSLDASGETADLLVEGDSGDSSIIGGAGDDIIFGGAGNDILTGGTGDDIFVWNKADVVSPAQDEITDFEGDVTNASATTQDVLNLSDLLSDGSHVIVGLAEDNTDPATGQHLQLSIKDVATDTVVQTIDLNNIAVNAGDSTTDMLNNLLANGGINDGI